MHFLDWPKTLLIADGFHECSDEEQLIGETCFLYDLDTPYNVTSNICKKISRDYKYELHIVKSQFEQKWISSTFPPFAAVYLSQWDEIIWALGAMAPACERKLYP